MRASAAGYWCKGGAKAWQFPTSITHGPLDNTLRFHNLDSQLCVTALSANSEKSTLATHFSCPSRSAS